MLSIDSYEADFLNETPPRREVVYEVQDLATGETIGYATTEENAHLIGAARKLLDALNYLLEQTVDQDLKYGIELTEGEQEARKMALGAIQDAAR